MSPPRKIQSAKRTGLYPRACASASLGLPENMKILLAQNHSGKREGKTMLQPKPSQSAI
ncbi:hypothetical protein EIKCOROL_01001 [Eikenella corrodens ATCC 23834]|uniref:Uncharacterized protein n=1 Tax=Eikenella corrodens ATCC 23834 TaxID=546274 RepID=C0DUH0_EIKCO|nr:hypothetical protein EIKCOROL_01001 [Eikenella corrodens ATCC 23834]